MEVKTLYTILGIFQIFFVSSFILSLKAHYQTNLPDYLRLFFIYPAVALLMIVFFWLDYLKITPAGFFPDLNFFSLIFHFTFLTWFILKVIKSSGHHNNEKTTRLVFILLILGSVINDYLSNSHHTYVLANGLLFIYTLFYFGKLFKINPAIHLISQPSFWIITGIFIGMGIILPFYIFHEFIVERVSNNVFNILALIGGAGYAIMHLFFIKGFTCTLNSKDLYVDTITNEKVKKLNK